MKKKLVRITTVPISLSGLLQGQSRFMGQFYEVIGISSDPNKLKKVGQQEGMRVIPVELTRKITPIKDLVALAHLWRILRKEKPFIVHSHTPKAGTIGMMAAKLAGVPHRLHTIAGLPLVEATGLKRKLLNTVEKITYACATKVYPNSVGLQQIVLDHKFTRKEKLKVIGHGSSNGIDTTYFNPELFSENTKSELRNKLRLANDDFVFVYVGRLVGDKGVNELISAFKKILKEHDKVQLLLVGSHEKELDPLLPETDEFIATSEKVIAAGWADDVRPYFSISHCLAFPSYREGFPNVVMQSGAMGLFSIVSNINGCNEIIQEGVNGTIIPTKDPEAIYRAMKYVLANQELLLGAKSTYRKLIQNRYERSFIWNEILKEYEELDTPIDN
ncbi:glycosyltransferase family 4 protein [Flagellimonas aequoris]|uniref:Glycosyltransferase family 1 protein n=1 Tax=Flagellimonas aequoris TaxID=2306997 RepID=A0A418NCR6_9FLAO|nr:glycosyltransferase family 4 protein [Allomuricauda aequoris]RIV74395.1 glycosyltransferase family 1 protein [Allomuricauda aequoris]TXK08517.1 glycosyltransferase family 4 protein [Allomuricauda aequoris]